MIQAAAAITVLALAAAAVSLLIDDPPPGPPTPPPAQPAQPAPQARDATVGQEAQVWFRDGRQPLEGILRESTRGRIVLEIAGVQTPIDRARIDRVVALPPLEDRFRDLRNATAPEDFEGILRLAEWIRARGRLDLALAEIERAIALRPNDPQAQQLRTVVLEQARLEGRRQRRIAEDRPDAAPDQPTPPRAPQRPGQNQEFPLLTPEQVNLIRVFEIDLANPPRLSISRESIDAFLDAYGGQNVMGRGVVPRTPEGRAAFHRLPPVEILSWMFDLRAREFYGSVQVRDDPASLRKFRDYVHRQILMNRCATYNCHGGQEAGRLWLATDRPHATETVYTNFLILERFRLANGMPLIDYAEPANSPLLQMGLPPERSRFRHPEVPGRRRVEPVFRSEEDERFQRAVAWIRAMYPQRPEYPIDYQPPVPRAANRTLPGMGDPPADPPPPR